MQKQMKKQATELDNSLKEQLRRVNILFDDKLTDLTRKSEELEKELKIVGEHCNSVAGNLE